MFIFMNEYVASKLQVYNFACALPIQNSAVNGTPLLPTEYSLVPVPTKVCCTGVVVACYMGWVCCCPVTLH